VRSRCGSGSGSVDVWRLPLCANAAIAVAASLVDDSSQRCDSLNQEPENLMRAYVTSQPYFLVKFEDRDLKVPVIETLMFEKEAAAADGTPRLLFRSLSNPDDLKVALAADEAEHLVSTASELLEKLAKSFAGTLPLVRDRP
jgi:hypothetical protein